MRRHFRKPHGKRRRAAIPACVAVTLPRARTRTARPAPHVTFHPDGRGGLLFDARAQKLFGLDRAAAFLWCSLAEEQDETVVVREYCRHAGVGIDDAMTHLCSLIDCWREAGLLDGGETPPDESNATRFGATARRRAPIPHRLLPKGGITVGCKVMESDIAVRFEDESMAARCAPLLDGLAGPPPASWSAAVDVRRARGGGATLHCPGRRPQPVALLDELPPVVLATVVHLALQHSAHHPAVHAALVACPSGGILLPAPSGHGKSTLSAGLLSAGFETLCDDTVVLDPARMTVDPVLPYLCVKSGAWSAVGRRFPGLWRHRAWRRADGMHVRYVDTARRKARHRAVRIGAMVFPRYDPAARTSLRALSAAEALERLLPCIDPIGCPLAAADIDRLIAWTDGAARYDLSLGSLDGGIAAIREIAS